MKHQGIIGITLALALVACCTQAEEPGQPEARSELARLDEHLTLGQPVEVENLTVWPVMTDEPLDVGEFVTLQEATEAGVAVVREVGGDDARQARDDGEDGQQEAGGEQQLVEELISVGGATVGTLVIENKGDLPILVCAGTVVTGGNQDRQIAQDLVIEAKATVPVDAFCVEQGRWTGSRFGLMTEGKFAIGATFAPPSVREPAQYREDQGAVW